MKEIEKRAKKIVKGCDSVIIATKKGVGIVGNEVAVLSLLSCLIAQMKEDTSEERIRMAVDLGLLDGDERVDYAIDKMRKNAKNAEKEVEKSIKELKKKIKEVRDESN